MYFLIFFIGAIIGSFINVLIIRLPLKINFITGRSACTSCGRVLRLYDLIPVLSFFILKGKCRFCKQKISPKYPFVEALTGLTAVLCYIYFGFTYETIFTFVFLSLLIIIAFIDYDTSEIPYSLQITLFIIAIISCFVFKEIKITTKLIGMICISIPMLLIAMFIKNTFGGGDIILVSICGFILGWKFILFSIIIAFITAGIYSIFLLLFKNKSKKHVFPFGPHICLGIYISILNINEFNLLLNI